MGTFNNKIVAEFTPPKTWVLEEDLSFETDTINNDDILLLEQITANIEDTGKGSGKVTFSTRPSHWISKVLMSCCSSPVCCFDDFFDFCLGALSPLSSLSSPSPSSSLSPSPSLPSPLLLLTFSSACHFSKSCNFLF